VRSDARKKWQPTQPHWDPAVCELIREAQAAAWDEGHDAATSAAPEDVWFGAWSHTHNPYRDRP
jgi:hypothetical protein